MRRGDCAPKVFLRSSYGVDRRCHSLSSSANRFSLCCNVVALGIGSSGRALRSTGGLPQRESAESVARVLSVLGVLLVVDVPLVTAFALSVPCALASDAAEAI